MLTKEELQDQEDRWAKKKNCKRSGGAGSSGWKMRKSEKRESRDYQGGGRPSKVRKFELVGGSWGQEKTTLDKAKTTWLDDQERVSEARDQDEFRIVCSEDQEQDQPTRGQCGDLPRPAFQ